MNIELGKSYYTRNGMEVKAVNVPEDTRLLTSVTIADTDVHYRLRFDGRYRCIFGVVEDHVLDIVSECLNPAPRIIRAIAYRNSADNTLAWFKPGTAEQDFSSLFKPEIIWTREPDQDKS